MDKEKLYKSMVNINMGLNDLYNELDMPGVPVNLLSCFSVSADYRLLKNYVDLRSILEDLNSCLNRMEPIVTELLYKDSND